MKNQCMTQLEKYFLAHVKLIIAIEINNNFIPISDKSIIMQICKIDFRSSNTGKNDSEIWNEFLFIGQK